MVADISRWRGNTRPIKTAEEKDVPARRSFRSRMNNQRRTEHFVEVPPPAPPQINITGYGEMNRGRQRR